MTTVLEAFRLTCLTMKYHISTRVHHRLRFPWALAAYNNGRPGLPFPTPHMLRFTHLLNTHTCLSFHSMPETIWKLYTHIHMFAATQSLSTFVWTCQALHSSYSFGFLTPVRLSGFWFLSCLFCPVCWSIDPCLFRYSEIGLSFGFVCYLPSVKNWITAASILSLIEFWHPSGPTLILHLAGY